MANATRVYGPLTSTDLDALRTEMAQHGILITANTPHGQVSAPHGFKLGWSYHSEQLALNLEGSVFLMGFAWSAIESGLAHVAPKAKQI